jgi:hypothetical protein
MAAPGFALATAPARKRPTPEVEAAVVGKTRELAPGRKSITASTSARAAVLPKIAAVKLANSVENMNAASANLARQPGAELARPEREAGTESGAG